MMDFFFRGQRIHESTGTRSKTLAKEIERKRRRALEEGAAGIKTRQRPLLFSVAASEWLELKQAVLAPSTLAIAETNLNRLLPTFGGMLLCDIEARDIARYQRARQDGGAAPRTINMEIGTLRAILKRNRHWANVQPDVKMLPERTDAGRAISAREEKALLAACAESRSRLLHPFVVLAIETGARYGVIRTLQWKRVDFENRCLQWGHDKTPAGTGRIVPLSPRAAAMLEFWAAQFPDRQPEHYVFPREMCAARGTAGTFGFSRSLPRNTDPTQPIGDIKEAWEAAKKRAGELLGTAVPLRCRFHDLRHTAASRMLEAGVPMTKVAKILGWAPGTMALMAHRYGHFTLEELRPAVAAISGFAKKRVGNNFRSSTDATGRREM
jgi:integrase